MKKLLLLLLTIFPLFIACAQTEKKQDSKEKTELERLDKSDINFDEETNLITYKSDGKLVNGIVHEKWGNGQLMQEYTVEEGKFNGISKIWYEDGTIEAESIFNNGELTFHKKYYQNGNLFQMVHMQNGMPKDTAKVFYPDGSLLSNYIFINGEYSDGICYNPLGEIINCDLINNGIQPEETNIEDKPKPEIIRNNITDQPIDGLLMKSYSDGAPWYHQCYRNGVMHGYACAWHENGEIMYTTNYIDGKENGIQRQFYPNGQMRGESEYKDHVPHGFQKTWYEDGTLKAENNFLNGEPHGSVKRYNADGKLIKHGTFEIGILISEECFENGKKVDCN